MFKKLLLYFTAKCWCQITRGGNHWNNRRHKVKGKKLLRMLKERKTSGVIKLLEKLKKDLLDEMEEMGGHGSLRRR